jgi:hypothetical protein
MTNDFLARAPDILALDLATRTGFVRGQPADAPAQIGSVRFGNADASNNAVFGNALTWISKLLEPEPRPTLLILEAMLPPNAKFGHTHTEVRDRLAGLHGIMRAVAHLRGVYEIAEYSVSDIRRHFLGDHLIKRDKAKEETMRRCRQLGWPVEDFDQSDACALWSLAASLIDPTLALKLSPLFNKNLRAVVQ